VAHDQIRTHIGPSLQRIDDGLRMPNLVFKCPGTDVRVLRSSGAALILDALDAGDHAIAFFRNKRAAKVVLFHQILGDMTKLSRKCLVYKENVHETILAFDQLASESSHC
jgi:hypothetical protein